MLLLLGILWLSGVTAEAIAARSSCSSDAKPCGEHSSCSGLWEQQYCLAQ